MRSVLALVLFALFATAAPAAARCRPAVGYGLVRVGTGPVAPGGTVLVTLRRVYEERQAVALPLGRVSIRGEGRITVAVPRPLAANLFAITLPSREDRYLIWPGHVSVEVDASAPVATTPTAAPSLAASPIGRTRIGTMAFAPTLELGAAAPADAVGVVLGWDEGTWFVPTGEAMIGPGRCTPDVPGYDPIDAGDQVTARFVGLGGDLSPEVGFTAVEPDSGPDRK